MRAILGVVFSIFFLYVAFGNDSGSSSGSSEEDDGPPNYITRIKDIIVQDKVDDYINDADVYITAYNETTAFIAGFFELVQEFPESAWCVVRGYQAKRNGGGWDDHCSVNKSAKLCDFMENDNLVMPELRNNSNVPSACPMIPQTYNINNFTLTGKGLPKDVPADQPHWRWNFTVYSEPSIYSPVLGWVCVEVYFDDGRDDNNSGDNNNNDNNNNNNNNNNHR